MRRREVLVAVGSLTPAALAGCSDPDDGGDGYALEQSGGDDTDPAQPRRGPERRPP